MTSVRVKRVKCGDSNIICVDDSKLIIDCGSDNRTQLLNAAESAYSTIKNEISDTSSTSIDLMITHFHKDHFNGILCIQKQKIFNNIYLPYSLIDESEVYSGAISKLLTIASPRSWGFRLSKQIIELFTKLEDLVINTENIKFVKARDLIKLGGERIFVLWPEINIKEKDIPASYSFVETISTTNITTHNMTFEVDELSLEEFNQKLNKMFDEILSLERETIFPIDKSLSSVIDNLRQRLQEYLMLLHNKNYTLVQYRESLKALFNASKESIDKNKELWDMLKKEDDDNANAVKEKLKVFGRNQYHALVDSMNTLSIVCHNKEGKYIFLGDASTNVIHKIKNDFVSSYSVVKIQHHATDNYYTLEMPIGNNYIVSNGGYNYRKVSKSIIEMIERRLNNTESKQIYCTNAHENAENHCGYFSAHGYCSSKCIQMTQKEEIFC